MEEQEFRNRMYAQIKGTNKYLTESHLNGLTTLQVIGRIHPKYREEYMEEYENLNQSNNE